MRVLIAICLAAVVARAQAGPEWIESRTKLILSTKDPYQVRDITRELLKSKDPAARKAAEKLLADEKLGEKRCGIVLGFGFKGHKSGVKPVAALLKDKVTAVRNHAAVALEDIAHKSATREILKAIKREKEEVVMKNLARALGACGAGSSTAAKELIKLSRGKSDLVQRNAMVAMHHMKKDQKVQKTLIRYAFLSGGKAGGGGGGGGGRGGRAGGGNNQVDDWRKRQGKIRAAALSLGMMRCKASVKKANQRLKSESEQAVKVAIKRCLDMIHGNIEVDAKQVLDERRDVCGDMILRDGEKK